MWAQMSGKLQASIRTKIQAKRPIRMATLCSGTDGPVAAFSAVVTQAGGVMDHENDLGKQRWILANFPKLPRLFADVAEVGQGTAINIISGELEPVPIGIDVLIVGFCCQDVSLENTARVEHAGDIAAGGGWAGGG